MSKDRVTVDEAYGRAIRSYYGSWFVAVGGMYVFVAFFTILYLRAPIGRALGSPDGYAETFLIDMGLLILLPMSLAIWLHLRHKNASAMMLRRVFLDRMQAEELVVARHNQQLVYKVVSKDAGHGQIEVIAVWNADGAVAAGQTYVAEAGSFAEFDATTFLNVQV